VGGVGVGVGGMCLGVGCGWVCGVGSGWFSQYRVLNSFHVFPLD